MLTKLYDYQEKTSNDIFNRIIEGEIIGAYIGYDTRYGKDNNFVVYCRKII